MSCIANSCPAISVNPPLQTQRTKRQMNERTDGRTDASLRPTVRASLIGGI